MLVPLTYGRLGRAWLHASSLRDLASSEVNDTAQKELEDYWEAHRTENVEDGVRKDKALAEPSSPVGGSKKDLKRRSRALSEAAGFSLRDNVLADDHPAMSMPEFMDVFGPLAFPVYRAALLRKRILLISSAPVQRSCNYGMYREKRASCGILTDGSVRYFDILESVSITRRESAFAGLSFADKTTFQRRRARYSGISKERDKECVGLG